MTNGKHFPKTLSQWEFDYGLPTNLPGITVACDFSPCSFTPRRSILPLLTKYISRLENDLSYQAKIFLLNETPREVTPCKISHICRCDFKCQVSVTGKTRSSFPLRCISGFCLNGGEQLNDVIANKLNILHFFALKLVIKLNVKLCNRP